MTMRSALYQTKLATRLGGFVYCQLTETTVREQTCRPTRTHYPESEPTSPCLFSLMLWFSGEERNTGLTRPVLEPTIYMYHTRGEHANHYTTDESSGIRTHNFSTLTFELGLNVQYTQQNQVLTYSNTMEHIENSKGQRTRNG